MSFIKNILGNSTQNQSVSKVGWRQLTNLGQLNEIGEVSTEKAVLIFKHSTRCSVSRMVLKQFENEFDLQDKIVPYFLNLLQHREISNTIASDYEVQHQSPQVIIIKDGKAVYNASHERIDTKQLEQFIF
ncbi:bacillithiol system redox-active protein YtxJ [Flavobacterium sp.]|jgi:bacillithiol system protein YtxJ|uniref:bacillithiol system redox-active protein YtxJ n=1 Tax=Flavobacterium sp. TaxID=239 RepID=UPI0037C0D46A